MLLPQWSQLTCFFHANTFCNRQTSNLNIPLIKICAAQWRGDSIQCVGKSLCEWVLHLLPLTGALYAQWIWVSHTSRPTCLLTSGPQDSVSTLTQSGPFLYSLCRWFPKWFQVLLWCMYVYLCMILCMYLYVCLCACQAEHSCQADCLQQLGTSEWAPMTRGNQILSLPLSSCCSLSLSFLSLGDHEQCTNLLIQTFFPC